jgi:glycosyltransferase involved in cell wall biosynthesis
VKIVSIALSPMPYNTPILNALARRVDLHTIYMCKEDRINRFIDIWGDEPTFACTFFPSKSLHSQSVDLQVQLSIGTSRQLAKLRPDVVLVVSWKPQVIEPLLWAKWSRRAAVMWSESTRFSGLLRGSLSTRFRRAILANVDGFVTNGSQASEYLGMLGVREDRIVTSRLPTSARGGASSVVRSTNAGEGVRFLYVGRLIPRKRPVELIRAFGAVAHEVPTATLTVVGQGELESEVRQASARVPHVRYIGFSEGEELASLYANADVLVLPALREVWGLVVNEALEHGLFVIATDEVGSAYDLLDEQSGIMVPADDLEQLSRAMIETAKALDLSDAARLQRTGAVADCTADRFADDIYKAAGLALRVRRTTARRERLSRRDNLSSSAESDT